ncbi:MAG: TrkH family potassium uptake protein [Saprospiraceae bacterium]|nr:TrkH family potassium uptake protein [Saprospiraceae bacterium]
MINHFAIIQVVGVLLALVGGLMFLPVLISLYYGSEDATAFLLSGSITLLVGASCYYLTIHRDNSVHKREGYLIVSMGWLAMFTFSALPYILSGHIPSLTNAYFETVSGMTTTGATILTDIEATPPGLLFWRSMTQWIGGMGIIVLTIAVFPLLGIGGIELFVAEAPGPVSDKLHPRIKATARALWVIYVSLTMILCLLLYLEGMTFFDAINHAMTTMATGGFSTKNASVAYFQAPIIHYTIMVFMFIAGVNYTIIIFLLRFRWRRIWRNEEFRGYLIIVGLLSLLVTFLVYSATEGNIERSFRDATFQVVSIITTTGYVTADYTSWKVSLTALFFILLFAGASAGSTSGGIKLIRHVVFLKNSVLEFKRLLHPKAIIRLRMNHEIVPARILTHILVFLLIYLGVFIVGTIVVSGLGLDLLSSMGAVATSLGNVGPGIGAVGPLDNFAGLNDPTKWVLMFLMLLGRLELFTILILFTPYFWKAK